MSQHTEGITRIENVPLTDQARSAILNAILEKRFEERLPSEDVLAEMLNVSRTTIRTALQSLEQDGIITRKRAIGTTVNAHVRASTLALQRMVGFDALLREQGYDVRVDLQWSRGKPPKEMAETFGLDPEQDSLLSEKSYYAGGSLAIHVRDVVPWSNLRDPNLSGDVEPSIFEFSSREWKRSVDHVVAEIVPVVKRSPSTTKTSVKKGEAFIRLLERHYADDGEQLAVSMVDADHSFIHFEVFRRRYA
jgi:GntR family transcriptional regulator